VWVWKPTPWPCMWEYYTLAQLCWCCWDNHARPERRWSWDERRPVQSASAVPDRRTVQSAQSRLLSRVVEELSWFRAVAQHVVGQQDTRHTTRLCHMSSTVRHCCIEFFVKLLSPFRIWCDRMNWLTGSTKFLSVHERATTSWCRRASTAQTARGAPRHIRTRYAVSVLDQQLQAWNGATTTSGWLISRGRRKRGGAHSERG
jgi:hypothetical protein